MCLLSVNVDLALVVGPGVCIPAGWAQEMSMKNPATGQPQGMRAFTVVWIGQFISLLGTSMTGFALPIYVFGETGRVQELALLGLAFMLPLIVISPFAGAIVDRSNRKLMMMLSDLAAGLMTIVVLILVSTGQLEIWHLFITNAISGLFQAFQWPAYSAAISVMLPKEQYARANGMISLAESGSGIFAPVLAAALLGFVGLQGVLLIDIFTFLFAIGALLLVYIPQPPRTAEGAEGQGNLLTEAAYGFKYIWRRPSLLGLQLVFMTGNFLTTIAMTIVPAMVLLRTDNNELALGSVQSAGAVGGVVGALVMSAWGGPKRLVHGVLLGWFFSSWLGVVLLGVGQTVPVWAVAGFCGIFFVPIINGSNQAIWQAKVAPDVQGRVFSIRRLIAWGIDPLARLLAIPLADVIFGPALRSGGALVNNSFITRLVGTGPGAGEAWVIVMCGVLASLVGLAAYLAPVVRNAETILPDHVAVAGVPAGTEVETAPAA